MSRFFPIPSVLGARRIETPDPDRQDERTLAKRDLRHRDALGLRDLLDDYNALGDEIEELPESVSRIKIAAAPADPARARAA